MEDICGTCIICKTSLMDGRPYDFVLFQELEKEEEIFNLTNDLPSQGETWRKVVHSKCYDSLFESKDLFDKVMQDLKEGK